MRKTLLAFVTLAAAAAHTSTAHGYSCNVFEGGFNCWVNNAEYTHCGTTSGCTGAAASGLVVADACDGYPIITCTGLFSCLDCQGNEYEWVQYQLVEDDEPRMLPSYYPIGWRTEYEGKKYECRQSHTAQAGWEPPNVYALWARVDQGPNWAPQVLYKAGDVATYSGKKYKAIQGHQSLPNWTPPVVPALWKRI